jgi:C1A family cysteine protease
MKAETTPTPVRRNFGWIPDLPDRRDLPLIPRAVLGQLPPVVDLSPTMPPVFDQGSLGACTSHAVISAHMFLQRQRNVLSRLFLYWNSRRIIGTTQWDSGAYIRDAMKSIAKEGSCRETRWPYVPRKFTVKPPSLQYREALSHQAIAYHRIPRSLVALEGCLAEGFPFVFGFSVYENFDHTGPMPKGSLVGGHAVLAVGYDNIAGRFKILNSWGSSWGNRGYFTLPHEYLLDPDLSDDFWTMRRVEG